MNGFQKEIYKKKVDIENRSFFTESPEKLMELLRKLFQKKQIVGIGFDVFDTILYGSLNRRDLNLFLSEVVAEYYRSETGKTINPQECFKIYVECRDLLRNNRVPLLTPDGIIIPEEQECEEILVLKAVGKLLELQNIDSLILTVLHQWQEFDLKNTRPITGMLGLISQTIILFGRQRVGVFSNHSGTQDHLLSVLKQNGYLEKDMFDPNNVSVSSNFGKQKYGVGLRKPSQLAFNIFSEHFLLSPTQIAFVGNNNRDLLFGTSSGGMGILI